jgi:hypothetical protein
MKFARVYLKVGGIEALEYVERVLYNSNNVTGSVIKGEHFLALLSLPSLDPILERYRKTDWEASVFQSIWIMSRRIGGPFPSIYGRK